MECFFGWVCRRLLFRATIDLLGSFCEEQRAKRRSFECLWMAKTAWNRIVVVLSLFFSLQKSFVVFFLVFLCLHVCPA